MDDKLEKITLVYELATQMLTPKSYQWKVVAEKMYEIAKIAKQRTKNGTETVEY